jgi:oxygen-dependent protoporphyrinogen oxidase
MDPSKKVLIIGAGIGGLASGYFLQQAGREVEIYERAPVPGGRIQLLEKEGARVDVGAQYFHTNYVETLRLLDSLGLKEKLIPIRAPVMLMRDGHGFLAKHNTLRYKVVPLSSNIKFARIFLTTLRNFRRLNPYFNDPLEEFEDIELAEYILKKCDRETLEFLVRPIITAFNMSDPEGESLAHFLRITKQFLTSSDTCLPTGMFTLPETLATRLPVKYDAVVEEIETQKDRVTGVRVRTRGETRRINADSLVCATPLKELGALLPVLTDDERAVTRDFTYSQFPMVVFFMKRRLPHNHWAYVFSRTENFQTSFTSDASFKCDRMVPSGNSILQVWFAGDAGMKLIDETDENLIRLATDEMRTVIPTISDEIESVEIIRHHTGMSRYRVGIYPRLRDLLESLRRFRGLHLVGDYYGHSTIETVVRSARRAADAILSAP